MGKVSIRELSQETGIPYYQIYFLVKKGLLKAETFKVGKKTYALFDKEEALKEIERLKEEGIITKTFNNFRIKISKN